MPTLDDTTILLTARKLEIAENPITPIGQRYELTKLLGAGGMGAVHLAVDRLTGDTVALKHVATPISQSESDRNTSTNLTLALEFHTMASLRHPNIVTVLDYGFDEHGRPYFTMEYVKDAETIVEAGKKISTGEKINLIVQLLHALVYLHRRGVLHRDLKPGNVLVVDGRVKVLDFGLSVLTEKSVEYKTESTVGTIAYMAPELFAGEAFSRTSDLYAVGMMTYEMLAGEYPYDRSNMMVLINEIVSKTPDLRIAGVGEEITRVLDKLLTKKREERYKLAEVVIRDLCQAANIPMPPESEEIRESFLQAAKFVGRKQEMDQLWQVWQTAMTGKGSVWLISGESGVGKSRLIEEFRIRTLVNGGMVLEGRAVREGAEPHALWRPAVRRLCLHANLSDRDASILKALVPDIGTLLQREVGDAPEIDRQSMQKRLVSTIEQLFRQQKRPILLLLEDLQWTSDNLPILNHLCQVIHEMPLLIIGCYRDDERPDLPEKIPDSQVLKLGRLGRDAIGELSEAMLGETGRKVHIVDLIARETEGNAFFIVEIVRALAEEAGELDKIDITVLPKYILAGGVQEFVQRRLNQAPVEARPLLRLAAVAGRELDQRLLQSISGETDLGIWLRTCAGVSILEVYNNQWRFTHQKLRDRLLADMAEDERRRLNQQVASAATALYGEKAEWAARLAYYWTQAEDTAKAFEYSSKAGTLALQTSAYRDAMEHFEKAASLAEQVGAPSERRAELQYQLGLTYTALGSSPLALPCYEGALSNLGLTVRKTTPSLGIDLLAQIIKQFGYQRFPRLTKGTEPTKQQRDVFLRASNIYARLGELYFYANRPLNSLYAAFKCTNYADAAGGNTYELAMGYGQFSLLLSATPLRGIADYYIRKTKLVAEQVGDRRTSAWALQFSSAYYGSQGKWKLSIKDAGESAAAHAELGDQRYYNQTLIVKSLGLLQLGNFDQAVELLDLIDSVAERHRDVQMLLWIAVTRSYIYNYTRAGGLLTVLEKINELLSQNESLADQIMGYGGLALAYLRIGKLDLAEKHAAKTLDLTTQTRPFAWHPFVGYVGSAEAYLGLWERDTPANLKEPTEKAINSLLGFASVFPFVEARARLCQGRYMLLRGKFKKGREESLKALEVAQRLEMRCDEGVAHYTLGKYFSADDAERRKHLERALEIFASLGAKKDLELTRQELAM
jgi:tetratricopeptide (TPR) repeat protein